MNGIPLIGWLALSTFIVFSQLALLNQSRRIQWLEAERKRLWKLLQEDRP